MQHLEHGKVSAISGTEPIMNMAGPQILRIMKITAIILLAGYLQVNARGYGQKVTVGNLDELQVIAYGTISKGFTTGNMATVKAPDIEKQPVNNPLLALKGRVPGLFITQANGDVESIDVLKDADATTIYGSRAANGAILITTKKDIESIDVLKDADATPIYGSRTANGAILITTKKGIESIDVLKDADATAIYGSRAANGAILITTKKG